MLSDKVAVTAEGSLKLVTESHLGTGYRRNRIPSAYDYPQGQEIRGFFGYIFLDFGRELSRSFADMPASIYFRDARPIHMKDGGELIPVIVGNRFINYKCMKCGEVLKHPVRKSAVVGVRIDRRVGRVNAMFRRESVVRGSFIFRASLNMKRYADSLYDFIAAMKYAEENGVRLGARSRKGKGLFTLRNMRYRVITLNDVRRRTEELERRKVLRIRFLSDVIADGGMITDGLILRSIKNASKFFHPEYESYRDPAISVRSVKALRPVERYFLDRKEGGFIRIRVSRETAIPAGTEIAFELRSDAPRMFYESMAVCEMVSGIGRRTSSGKGEFAIL